MLWVNLICCQYLFCIRQHCTLFLRRDRLLRCKAPIKQGNPAALQSKLRSIRFCNICAVVKCVGCVLRRLETQTIIQCVHRKLSRCRVIRVKSLSGLQVDHAEFQGYHDVPVEAVRIRNITVVVVGIIVCLHCHGEGLDQRGNPFGAANVARTRLRRGIGRRHEAKNYHNCQQQADDSFLHIHNATFLRNTPIEFQNESNRYFVIK